MKDSVHIKKHTNKSFKPTLPFSTSSASSCKSQGSIFVMFILGLMIIFSLESGTNRETSRPRETLHQELSYGRHAQYKYRTCILVSLQNQRHCQKFKNCQNSSKYKYEKKFSISSKQRLPSIIPPSYMRIQYQSRQEGYSIYELNNS